MRVRGHTLIMEGAAYKDDPTAFGKVGRVQWGTAGGVGFALCSCGARSPIFDSASKRKAWHRNHKAEVSR